MKKILIVDDSAAEVANLKAIVSEAGWMPVCAMSGAEAVTRAKAERPHLILMDVIMPGMDGYEAVRQLQADLATKHIPVIIVSTKNQKADHLWARMQGASTLVGKPYSRDELVGAIQTVLN